MAGGMATSAAAARNGRAEAMGARRRAAMHRGHVSDEDLAFIEEIWAKYDTNDDGTMELSELTQLMTEMNEDVAPSTKEVKMLVKAADADRNGLIDKSELKKLIAIWFVIAEEKNSKWTVDNLKRELRQAFQGCMADNHAEGVIVKYPGEQAVEYWNHTKVRMEENYHSGQSDVLS